MTLRIRDARARSLARQLAERRRVTMTEAVIQALEAELRREAEAVPLATRIARIAGELQAMAEPGCRSMTRDEIDAMWGHRGSSTPR